MTGQPLLTDKPHDVPFFHNIFSNIKNGFEWLTFIYSFPGGSVVKNLSANAEAAGDGGFDSWVEKTPWKRKWQPTPVFRELHGPRNLAGYSPWALKESDTIEHTVLIYTHIELFKSLSKQLSAICLFLFGFFQA